MWLGRSCLIALFLVAPRVVWAAPSNPEILAASDIANADVDDASFDRLCTEGDRLRAQGRTIDAANTYMKALAIKADPVVGGRLGVLLVAEQDYLRASSLLLQALQQARHVTEAERLSFHEAYERAWRELGWIEVKVSVAGAETTLDGERKNAAGDTRFFLFVMPGKHELRARHEGFEDATTSFVIAKGETQPVELILNPLPTRVTNDDEQRLRIRQNVLGSAPENELEVPPEDEPTDKEPIFGGVEGAPRLMKPRLSLEAGALMLFGVATWQPAVGAMIGIRYRANEYVSLGFEGRAAWVMEGIAGSSIYAMTAGGLASVCGHWKWVYGCGLGHLGIINVSFEPPTYIEASTSTFQPGAGLRLGGMKRFGNGLIVQGRMDALALGSETRIIVGSTLIRAQPPFQLGVQLLGGWEF